MDSMDPIEKKRWLAMAAVGLWILQAAYIVFPFDLLPDFIPVIGWIDDLIALGGLTMTTIWAAKKIREADFPALFADEPEKLEAEPYEPIPADVIRTM